MFLVVAYLILSLTEAALSSSSCTNYHPSRAPEQLDYGRGFVYHASQLICDLTYDQATTVLVSDVSFAGSAATVTDLGGNSWRLEFQISVSVTSTSLIVLSDTIFADYDFYVEEAEISSVRLLYTSPPAESQAVKDEREVSLVSKFVTGIYFRVVYSKRIADALGGNTVISTSNFRVNDNSGNFLFSPSQLTVVNRQTVEFPIDLTAAVAGATAADFQLELVASDEVLGETKTVTYDTVAPEIVSVLADSLVQDALTVNVVWSKKIVKPEFSVTISLTPADATCANFQIISDSEFSFTCTPGTDVSQNLKLDISASPLARDLPGNAADTTAVFNLETLVVMGPPSEFAPVQISFVRSSQYPKEYEAVTGTSGNEFGDLEISWGSAITAVSYSVKIESANSVASDFQTIELVNVIGNSLTIPLTEDSRFRIGGIYKATVTGIDDFAQTHSEEVSVAHSAVVFVSDQGEIVLPEVAVGTALWADDEEISITRVSVVANTETTQVYADLNTNTDKLEVVGIRTWVGTDENDPCVFQTEDNRCTNFRLEIYHPYDEANIVLMSPLRVRFEFNREISDSFIPQLRQWEPLLSNWTLANEFCSPADAFNAYNGISVYEISLCKLGGVALFFEIPQEYPEAGNFASAIPPNPFSVGQPTMACILFTGITLLLTLIARFVIWALYLRRATKNRSIALANIGSPAPYSQAVLSGRDLADQQRIEADLSLEAQIQVTRSRRNHHAN